MDNDNDNDNEWERRLLLLEAKRRALRRGGMSWEDIFAAESDIEYYRW